MSNDLISRSAVIELIENCHVLEDAYCLIDYINEMRTAYDVDKVVEQLEQDSQNIELIYPTDQGYDYEDAIGIDVNKAKQIVKSGGIE